MQTLTLDTPALADRLRRNGGVVKRREMLAAGFTDHQIRQAYRCGDLVRIAHGVYRPRGLSEVPHIILAQRAATARHGYVSHQSAALFHGFPLRIKPIRPHITIPDKRKRPKRCRLRPVVHVASRARHPGDDRVTTALDTVLDCIGELPLIDAVALVDGALNSGKVDVVELARVAGHRGGPGSAKIREAVELTDQAAESMLESFLRLRLKPHLPELQSQVWVECKDGQHRRLDFALPELGLAIETDGYAAHGGLSAFQDDRTRRAELAAVGWWHISFTWADVTDRPDWVVRRVLACIEHIIRRRVAGRLRAAVPPPGVEPVREIGDRSLRPRTSGARVSRNGPTRSRRTSTAPAPRRSGAAGDSPNCAPT